MDFDKLKELTGLAGKKGHVLYAIMFRRVGVGFHWFSYDKYLKQRFVGSRDPDQWKEGLVVYNYFDTIEDAIKEETKRMSEMKDIALSSVQEADDTMEKERQTKYMLNISRRFSF